MVIMHSVLASELLCVRERRHANDRHISVFAAIRTYAIYDQSRVVFFCVLGLGLLFPFGDIVSKISIICSLSCPCSVGSIVLQDKTTVHSHRPFLNVARSVLCLMD